ncbi:MAG: ACP S-malonyltransferase, partial [Phycisphaerales bacterium]|nr:ACP S-malonyltransferase [Phycisphaerales bacterium]
LSELCFNGPAERLNQTDVAQPALFATAVASFQGLLENWGGADIEHAAGLSLGEYTALHLAGAFSFHEGMRLVATRGRLMQEAAEASDGSMVALTGADEETAEALCKAARGDDVLVCANFNSPGQIVISGSKSACDRAVELAPDNGIRATQLAVAGAFHSPLMAPAAEKMASALQEVDFQPLNAIVWSNVTGSPHEPDNPELLRQRLVEQITSPVRWAQGCANLAAVLAESESTPTVHELAPGKVLKGLFRRIDRSVEVTTHDQPEAVQKSS